MLLVSKGENNDGFTYDVSARFGSNEIEYTLFNTVNPSYGPDTPTSFKPGTLLNEEVQFQVDLSNEIDMGTGVSDGCCLWFQLSR